MAHYQGQRLRLKEKKRKQPMGYVLSSPDYPRSLFVPGHYETACGGCDTINGLDRIYELVEMGKSNGMDVMFEGLIVCSDYKRLVALHEKYGPDEVLVIGLTTPLDLSISSVQSRRLEKGNTKPLNPTNTESKFKTNQRVLERFVEAGVNVQWLSREDALEKILKEFRRGR